MTSVFYFLKIYYSLPTNPPPKPIYHDSFSFCYFLFFISSIFSSPEANDYDEGDQNGNPLTEDEGNGRLISDGACAITLSFCYFLFYSFPLSSSEANDYDEEDETGNPLTEDERNGRLISVGACAINLRLDRLIRFRWSVAYPCLCFLRSTVPRHGLFELYCGSYHPDFLNDFKAILTQ